VARHGPMVLGVCRRALDDPHDVDDAFQATFLVLVRKAHSIRTADSLAPWLYSVACRTAQRARANASRYCTGNEEPIEEVELSSEDAYKLDLRPLIYQELGRLPAKYQAPIVLCHLEGRTHEEAARLLDWPVGTVSGRLSRGRKLLRTRLERRGVAVPSAIISAVWLSGSQSAVTTPLVECTRKVATRFAAAQSISASILSLTQGVLKAMFLRKLGTISFAIVLIGAISGAGLLAPWSSPAARQPAQSRQPATLSTQDPEATPVPEANPAPESQPQPTTGSQSLLADNCPADCPVTRSVVGRPNCPISMAANALRGMLGHVTEWSMASK